MSWFRAPRRCWSCRGENVALYEMAPGPDGLPWYLCRMCWRNPPLEPRLARRSPARTRRAR